MTSDRPKEILSPVDFSDLSALGLRFAELLGGCAQAHITALYAHSFDPPAYFTSSQVEQLRRSFLDSISQAKARLREFVASQTARAGAHIDIRVEEGRPADVIDRVAAELGADWIVMGTHGRSGVNRWMLGSVAEHVLRRSRVPVLTVRAGADPHKPIRNILCPVNNTRAARRALALATELARCAGARVSVLHVEEPGASDSIEDLCAWAPEADRSYCDIRPVRSGQAALEIVSLSAEPDCDLLVIGARHRRFFDSTVLGATTLRVVRHARCPVFTVPDAVDG